MSNNLNEIYYDSLTGLTNKRFIEENYLNYIISHDKANFVMIDFTKFKKINDSYGHDVGDKCLIVFADKIKNYFKDSIYARLHGDEFVIITHLDDNAIKKILKLVEYSIENEVKSGTIPINFGFNAGSAECTESIDDVIEKADYMMYYAKKNKKRYQPYDEELYKIKLQENNLKENFSKKIEKEKFTYYGKNMYDVKGNRTNNVRISTKDENGASLLNNYLYEIIRSDNEIVKFDLHNLRTIIEKTSMTYSKDTFFLNIDYRSLYSLNELLSFLKCIKDGTINRLDNIVLSIDISSIESNEYDITLEIIQLLHNYGIKINIDKVDCYLSDYFLISSNPDYIKLSHMFWKQAEDNDFTKKILESKINTYKLIGKNTRLIFDKITTKDESSFVKSICPDDTLLIGNYYEKEKKLVLD